MVNVLINSFATTTIEDFPKERSEMLSLIRATDQCRVVSFGKVRKFQAIGLRMSKNKWQVQDTDQRWYSSFWCQS